MEYRPGGPSISTIPQSLVAEETEIESLPPLPNHHSPPAIQEQPKSDFEEKLLFNEHKRTIERTDGIDDIESYLQRRGITSRPIPGGNWNVQDPIGWTRDFGRRSQAIQDHLDKMVRLQPGDEGYFHVDDIKVTNVTIVRTKEQAQIVLRQLYNAPKTMFHACDTEVMAIDLKEKGPVGNGYVTCLSMYAGPAFDYGLGDGPGTCLWIDNLDDACGVLQEFKDWLEDERYLKVWHNVGFDRHVLWNEGINVQGFGGDTMHMARLQNTSRTRFSLEALTTVLLGNDTEVTEQQQSIENGSKTSSTTETTAAAAASSKTTAAAAEDDRKKSMKELFGVPKKRQDGSDSKVKVVPPVEVLQRDPTHRTKWIQYSAKDAKSTWYVSLLSLFVAAAAPVRRFSCFGNLGLF